MAEDVIVQMYQRERVRMKEKVFSFIEEHKMIKENEKILLGVSGGADSMCLFWLLSEYIREKKADMVVVHVNHGIRGKEADEDERFVADICAEQKIVFYAVHTDIPKLAEERQLSEEECGRNERYRIFSEYAEKHGCSKIAVAHNKNDVAETVLFNLFRGTGLKGVAGISPVRDRLIRPLLCLERCEIEKYMSDNGYKYRTDSTNLEDAYTRNRIRNDILKKAVETINPEAVEHVFSFAKKAAETEKYLAHKTEMLYNQIVTEKEGRLYLNIEGLAEEEALLQKETVRLCIARMAGRLKDIEAVHVESILELVGRQTGRQLSIPYGIIVKKEYDNLVFLKGDYKTEINSEVIKKIFSGKTNENYIVPLPYFNKKLRLSLYNYDKNDIIPKSDCVKWFDYGKLASICAGEEVALEIRSAKETDILQIGKERGTKKIKDYFKDAKIAVDERKVYPLLTCNKYVLWVIGKRSGEAFFVDENTETVLIAEII